MRSRCTNPKAKGYEYYGGRGVAVCERWMKSFPDFLADMGFRPVDKESIDRIDNAKNYEPGNCRWATRQEQNANKRPKDRSRRYGTISADGADMIRLAATTGRRNLPELARACGINPYTFESVVYNQSWMC